MFVRRVAAARRRLGQIADVGRSVVHGGTATLVAAAVAWRPHLSGSALVGAGLLALRSRPLAASVLLGAGLAGVADVADRIIRRPAPTPGPNDPGPDDLAVLTANVLIGRADAGELAALVAREVPDFAVLPEAGSDFRDKLMPLLDGLGYRSWVSTPPGVPDGPSVVLLVAERAGNIRVRSGTGMRRRYLEATGGVLGERRLFAVHTDAPTSRGRTARWRAELDLIGRWCAAPLPPLVVGDFNATLDHAELRAALGGCRSAAAGTGRGLVSTFPSVFPRWLGIQIDHVLVPADAVTTGFSVHDIAGTDHRAVLARVRL
jgi:endonuclease/exonuclease/phosphatase (EEP) superfamily protein YafD